MSQTPLHGLGDEGRMGLVDNKFDRPAVTPEPGMPKKRRRSTGKVRRQPHQRAKGAGSPDHVGLKQPF
jgi:hypothetical protein